MQTMNLYRIEQAGSVMECVSEMADTILNHFGDFADEMDGEEDSIPAAKIDMITADTDELRSIRDRLVEIEKHYRA